MQKNVLSKVLLLVDLIIEREIIYSLTNCLYHMIDIMKWFFWFESLYRMYRCVLDIEKSAFKSYM